MTAHLVLEAWVEWRHPGTRREDEEHSVKRLLRFLQRSLQFSFYIDFILTKSFLDERMSCSESDSESSYDFQVSDILQWPTTVTAKANHSRRNQIHSREKQITHGKSKSLTAKANHFNKTAKAHLLALFSAKMF